jgi:hypothetical protein
MRRVCWGFYGLAGLSEKKAIKVMAADKRAALQMRARVRVAMRLASRTGEPSDTLRRYYARCRDRRPVSAELYAEMAQFVPPLRFLDLNGERE